MRPVLVFGASSDKDIRRIIVELSPVVSDILVVHSDHHRAVDCHSLVERISFVSNVITPVERPRRAKRKAKEPNT